MKSTIFALLPLASFAFAESACDAKPQTVTSTAYEYASVTVTLAHKQRATPDAAMCSRRTVTTTEVERVTVTVGSDDKPAETINVTSTSTMYLETTVTVRPTQAACAVSSSKQWGNYPNATYHSTGAAVKPTAQLPEFSIIGQAVAPTSADIISSTIPTSEAKAPSAPSPIPEAAKDTRAAAAGSHVGEATFYGGNTAGGMCSFTGYTIPSNLFGTALSDSNWANAEACGQCVSVTGPSGTKITAMVVDQCPGCGNNHLDLYPDAFKKLADPSKGVINISWDYVPCGITDCTEEQIRHKQVLVQHAGHECKCWCQQTRGVDRWR
jgi:rare lipoprotein A (peptidoglycan hydrolase)